MLDQWLAWVIANAIVEQAANCPDVIGGYRRYGIERVEAGAGDDLPSGAVPMLDQALLPNGIRKALPHSPGVGWRERSGRHERALRRTGRVRAGHKTPIHARRRSWARRCRRLGARSSRAARGYGENEPEAQERAKMPACLAPPPAQHIAYSGCSLRMHMLYLSRSPPILVGSWFGNRLLLRWLIFPASTAPQCPLQHLVAPQVGRACERSGSARSPWARGDKREQQAHRPC